MNVEQEHQDFEAWFCKEIKPKLTGNDFIVKSIAERGWFAHADLRKQDREPVKMPSDEEIDVTFRAVLPEFVGWLGYDSVRKFARALLARYGQPAASAEHIVTEEMVSRFLGWKLPKDFYPDCGVSFNPPSDPLFWPIGTNLLTDPQARAMLEYVLQAPVATQPTHTLSWPDYTCIRITKLNMGDRWDATCEGFGTVSGCNMIFPRRTPHEALDAILVELGEQQHVLGIDSYNASQHAASAEQADGQNELKAMYAAARHAGWAFAKYADGVVRMVPLVVGEAQAADAQAQQDADDGAHDGRH